MNNATKDVYRDVIVGCVAAGMPISGWVLSLVNIKAYLLPVIAITIWFATRRLTRAVAGRLPRAKTGSSPD